jgi:predicted methyltransferase
MRALFALATILAGATMMSGSALTASPAKPNKMLTTAIAASHRTPANVARDKYRNPAATLAFFKVKPNSKVVELWPGGGWYTEILAPYLAKQGRLTVAPPLGARSDSMRKFLDGNTAVYGKVGMATFPMKEGGTAVAPNSVDVVLTFRNVHNWRFGGVDGTQEAFNQIYAMLKPGGVLGIVDHRLPEAMDSAKEEKSGYMKRSSIVGFAEKSGFKLDGETEINANPKDTHDWPDGVWTLPPVYRLKDVDREKYAAIGESDRMTLRFVKPRK